MRNLSPCGSWRGTIRRRQSGILSLVTEVCVKPWMLCVGTNLLRSREFSKSGSKNYNLSGVFDEQDGGACLLLYSPPQFNNEIFHHKSDHLGGPSAPSDWACLTQSARARFKRLKAVQRVKIPVPSAALCLSRCVRYRLKRSPSPNYPLGRPPRRFKGI